MRSPVDYACIIPLGIMLGFLSSTVQADFKWTPYGFIKADVTGASREVESFGNMNLVAPTNVSPASLYSATQTSYQNNRGALSFQTGQSRLGTYIENGNISGQIEFDFLNFNADASPTAQVSPRIRLLRVEYTFSAEHKVSMGQEWDLFSAPDRPLTYNFVGLYFHAGNVGFLKQQMRYLFTPNDWEISVGAALLRANPTPSNSEIELTGLPNLAARIIAPLAHGIKTGASAVVGKTRPAAFPSSLCGVYGINTFISIVTESGFKLRENFYYGQNLASAGTLALALASPAGSRHEWGGTITASQSLSQYFSMLGGLGFSKIIEGSGAKYDTTGTNPSFNILSNWKAEFALSYTPTPELAFYVQPTFFQTAFISQRDASKSLVQAFVLEGGALYRF